MAGTHASTDAALELLALGGHRLERGRQCRNLRGQGLARLGLAGDAGLRRGQAAREVVHVLALQLEPTYHHTTQPSPHHDRGKGPHVRVLELGPLGRQLQTALLGLLVHPEEFLVVRANVGQLETLAEC
jgi:hypothetical protein